MGTVKTDFVRYPDYISNALLNLSSLQASLTNNRFPVIATYPTKPLALGTLIVYFKPIPTFDQSSLLSVSSMKIEARSHSQILHIDFAI